MVVFIALPAGDVRLGVTSVETTALGVAWAHCRCGFQFTAESEAEVVTRAERHDWWADHHRAEHARAIYAGREREGVRPSR